MTISYTPEVLEGDHPTLKFAYPADTKITGSWPESLISEPDAASFREPDLFHVGGEIPIVGVATDLAIPKFDDCCAAHFEWGVRSR